MHDQPPDPNSREERRSPKADAADYQARFREIISDPINLLIKRVPEAGRTADGYVYLHNGNYVKIGGAGAYYDEFSEILVLNRGVHEPLEEYAFQECIGNLGDAPFMLELGSYWAHYSMWLKRVRPDATVVMVEPDAANLEAGRLNFERNGFAGEFMHDIVAPGRFEVDKFRRERNNPNLAILHADIQGAELEMIDGCRQTLSDGAIDLLFISTHSQELHYAVRDRLSAHGYRIEISSDFEHETTSYDGLIVASNPSLPARFEDFHPLGRTELATSSPADIVRGLARQLRVT